MSDTPQTTAPVLVAVPSEAPGGLDAACADHFGRCSHFTVAEFVDGEPTRFAVVENAPHHEGGCMTPVVMLAQNGVSALIVNGIGGRPLAGCTQMGIDVYAGKRGSVADSLRAFGEGSLSLVGPEGACQH